MAESKSKTPTPMTMINFRVPMDEHYDWSTLQKAYGLSQHAIFQIGLAVAGKHYRNKNIKTINPLGGSK